MADVIALKKSDRVPIVTVTDFFFPVDDGITCEDAMNDYEQMAISWKNGMKKYNWDMAPHPHAIRSARVWEMLDLKTFYVKTLIDTLRESGGLIVDSSTTGPPKESKPENVEAMTKTAFEYGSN